jgi:WD40 repeat protein
LGVSFDRSIKIWNFNTGQLINTLHGHLDQVYSLIYLEKGSKLISGSRDSVIKIWNL